jgi:thioester reductase-like protein
MLKDKNLYGEFYKQALKTPSNICLFDEGITLTYQEALERIAGISEMLLKQGIKPGDVVALYMPKSFDVLLSFLAISKVGGVALTLDVAFSDKQIEFILVDANVKLWLSKEFKPTFSTTVPHISLNGFDERSNALISQYQDHHAAWLVYSSGTTGNPKGIVISHYAMLASFGFRYKTQDYLPSDKIACNIYFFWEAFRPLLKGASVYLLPDDILHDVAKLCLAIERHQINEILFTPSYADIFLSQLSDKEKIKLKSLKRIWLNGEVVGKDLAVKAQAQLPETIFYNLYSISETFDVACLPLTSLADTEDDIASIGQVFDEVTAVVLDDNKQVASPFQKGELYIGGEGLCEGYLNLPSLNQKNFLDASETSLGIRLFKTGDSAYIDKEKRIFILGRCDHVLKLRGYNVSLLAIESVIKSCLPIKQCVVKLSGNSASSDMLLAYIEAENQNDFLKKYPIDKIGTSDPIKKVLSEHLPFYMLPQRYLLNEFKLNAYSAKLERKQFEANSVNDEKNQLMALWCQLLKIDTVSDTDCFYALGGNSLTVIQLLFELKKQFNLSLDIHTFNDNSQLSALYGLLLGETSKKQNHAYIHDAQISIDAKTTSYPTSIEHSKGVFLTGVTGFLGVHLLKRLLLETKAPIYCLVRGENSTAVTQKFEGALKQYKIEISSHRSRVHLIIGNIEKPQLGLTHSAYQALCKTTDYICHLASNVNLLLPYAVLKPTIVTGTKNLIAFAFERHTKPCAIISSDAVFPDISSTFDDSFISEENAKKLNYGYAQAKWAVEKLCQSLHSLPFSLFRLGNLGPSTESFIFNQHDFNLQLLEEIISTKQAPHSLSIEMTPVNLICDNIISLLKNTPLERQIYNMSNSHRIDKKRLADALNTPLTTTTDMGWVESIQQNESAIAPLLNIKSLWRAASYHLTPSFEAAPISYEYLNAIVSSLIKESEHA